MNPISNLRIHTKPVKLVEKPSDETGSKANGIIKISESRQEEERVLKKIQKFHEQSNEMGTVISKISLKLKKDISIKIGELNELKQKQKIHLNQK